MNALKENLEEVEIGSSVASIQSLLESQKELFHSQIDQLQFVVVKQCQLTGVNPLAQEMAAGALSINIGKRPRDLLNPKAIKYMQAVFAIKDAISKKESREISALFGVTITQVRDFFASQRTRVRKQVRLSREKVVRDSSSKEPNNVVLDAAVPVEPISVEPVPLSSVGPISVEEAPSCSTQDDAPPGLDELDRHFVENIFTMMRKEETFAGQGKLLEWILKIQNSTVLSWFLTKGGVMILATWLTQAAIEEQTTVLDIILKVLCHLPIQKALPEHMSAILHSVNKLRFYRTTDISNRARVLLSRWSKVYAKIQALKKSNGLKSPAEEQNELLLKQSISEIMEDESWQSNIENSEGGLVPSNVRKLEPSQAPKLLTASTDESSRKHALGAAASHNRERRKVQLVEQPGQKTAGKGSQATKTTPVSQGRPMSADDIQKAKMRALYMQGKFGKAGSSSNGINEIKTESPNKFLKNPRSSSLPLSKSLVLPKPEEPKRPVLLPTLTSNRTEMVDPNKKMESSESPQEDCKTTNRIETLYQSQKMNSLEPPAEKCQTSSKMETIDQIQRINSQETSWEKCQTSNRMETIDQNQKMNLPVTPLEKFNLPNRMEALETPLEKFKLPNRMEAPETQLEKLKLPNKMEAPETQLEKLILPIRMGALGPNEKMDSDEPPLERCKKVQIPWQTPPEIKLSEHWSVSAGEHSKEIDIQKNRNRREKEIIYIAVKEIPPNPKEPWDREMDYDDTLTPVIPSEQQPDVDSTEPHVNDAAPSSSSHIATEPDLELLAVLLKNPELVFALTSGTATNLRSQDTVKLLDMIKTAGGSGLAANMNRFPKQASEKVEVSLPSPTPPSNPGTSGWRPETVRNPFSQQNSTANRIAPASNSANAPALTQQLVAAMTHLFPQSNARTMAPAAATQNHQAVAPAYTPSIQATASPSLRIDSLTNIKPSSHTAYSTPTYVSRQQIQLQPQQQPLTDPWRSRQGFANSYPQHVQNHYNAPMGGHPQPQLRPGREYVRNAAGYESWSLDDSPTRSPGYAPGRNPDPGANPGWGYRPDGSWQQNSSGYRDYSRQGNRRWRR